MITRTKLAAEDWLTLALDTLDNQGIHKVNVEYLARKLGVTKGSFYWHFTNRGTFIKAMLDYWADNLTTDVIERSGQGAYNAKEKLYNLMVIITDEQVGRYETAIRAWATHDDMARAKLQKVDKQRLKYVTKLFIDMKFNKEDAELRARLVLYYQVAEHGILLNDSKAKRKKLLEQRFELLTKH